MDRQQPDHFQKGNGGQREERTAQAETGIADTRPDNGCQHRSDPHADPRCQPEMGDQQRGRVSPDAVKHHMAQRQLSGIAADNVPGGRQGRKYADGDKDMDQKGRSRKHRNQHQQRQQSQRAIDLRAGQLEGEHVHHGPALHVDHRLLRHEITPSRGQSRTDPSA